MKVHAFMISRANTPQRKATLLETISSAYETAGYEFDFTLHAIDPALDDFEELDALAIKHKFVIRSYDQLQGQHTIMNSSLAWAKEGGFDLLLRLDDDCKFVTGKWLDKLVDAASKLGPNFIISPTVIGLMNPPERSEVVEVEGVKVQFLYTAIGGVCRLHNVESLTRSNDPYISDVRSPMGFGDATGIGKWAARNNQWMCYLTHVKVKHNTEKQMAEDPAYHYDHALCQHIPFIPLDCCETT